MKELFNTCTGFKWDEGNVLKNWKKPERVLFPNLQPSTKTISLRLPEYILDEIKMLARKRDVPYQSLIKMFLKDRLNEELRHSG